MKVKDCKGKEHEIITIEELYLWAKEKGLEKSGIGLSIYDDDKEYEYCEELFIEDINVGGFFINGKVVENCPMIWLNNH